MITQAELDQILTLTGLRLFPNVGFTGGATPSGQRPILAQTMPFALCSGNNAGAGTGVMNLTAIWLIQGMVITNINFVVGGTAEASGSHCLFGLYDDGRGTATTNQLKLLATTADNTATGFMAANTNMGVALTSPFTVTYTGIHYVCLMTAATTQPTMVGTVKGGTAASNINFPLTPGGVANTGLFWAASAGSALTTALPDPSGALTAVAMGMYAYVS